MRHERPSNQGEARSSALWGKGSGDQSRGSALWGRGGRSGIALLALVVSVIIPAAGIAGGNQHAALVPADLLAQAEASPNGTFDVIVQGGKGRSSDDVARDVSSESGTTKRRFGSIDGVSATLSGAELVKLARHPHVQAITPNASLSLTSYESAEMWRSVVGVNKLYGGPLTPAIAILDSGVDSTKLADFGSRVVTSVNFSSLAPGVPGDQLGHGTMVAGIAAGGGGLLAKYRGSAPQSPIVDLKVTDAQGQALTADVIAAIDWLLANKGKYNVRVANFSLVGNIEASFLSDPLNKAVERLWLSGVVVVAAVGNNGSATGPSKIGAPANDPFVITVGATDIASSGNLADDVRATWSAYGYTADGFAKPDVTAPGRYMIAPVPMSSVFTATKPERIVEPGYMWMSGTSFAAPVVAGAAAQLLARNSGWSPDQVKGALMLTTTYNASLGLQMGVGEINAAAAAAVSGPPNPNENLYKFVSSNQFDSSAWAAYVSTNANWTAANWTAANWTSANWTSANWTAANWTSANWTSANWTASNWTASNWTVSIWDE
jgi:serine protease AprX